MNFFGQTLGLELAEVCWKRRVASTGLVGGATQCSVCGRWGQVPAAQPPSCLSVGSLSPVGRPCAPSGSQCCSSRFLGEPTGEPVVIGWMPAASLYFRDPDGNLLELLAMLPDSPIRSGNCQLESLEPNSRIRSSLAAGMMIGVQECSSQ